MGARGRHSTGNDDYRTPKFWVELCRSVLGEIDLDPASNAYANRYWVRAARYYNRRQNGLRQPWRGRVFCNPPYSGGQKRAFCEKFVEEYEAGRMRAGIILVTASIGENWFWDMWRVDVAFPRRRIQFENAPSPSWGNAFFYLGPAPGRFKLLFEANECRVVPGRDVRKRKVVSITTSSQRR